MSKDCFLTNTNWQEMRSFWNERYEAPEYAYGETPNEFMKEQLKLLPTGSILFPAEGEGRNAVYAAQQDWDVVCFDISEEGRKKALCLAQDKEVQIDYRLGSLETISREERFDAVALIENIFFDSKSFILLKAERTSLLLNVFRFKFFH